VVYSEIRGPENRLTSQLLLLLRRKSDLRVTIKDVAKKVGVSTATISNVITGAKYVREDLKERILHEMEVMGYQPNVIARSLKVNKTMRIGVIVPDITNPFFSDIIKRIDSIVSNDEYQLIVCNAEDDIKKEQKLFESFMKGGGVDGLIMIAPRMGEEDFYSTIPIPLIIVDRPAFYKSINDTAYVYTDNYQGAALIANHFIDKGYEKFVCIAGPKSVPNADLRYSGFVDTLIEKGIKQNNIIVVRGEFNFTSGYESMNKVLDSLDLKTTKPAFFVGNDIAAWGAIEAAKHRSLEIPKNLGIAGYDNIYFSNFIERGLTTVDNSTENMGKEAGTIMLKRLASGKQMSRKQIMLDSLLIERNTV